MAILESPGHSISHKIFCDSFGLRSKDSADSPTTWFHASTATREESRITPISEVCVCVCVCVLGPGTLGRLVGITAFPDLPPTPRALVPLLNLLAIFPPLWFYAL